VIGAQAHACNCGPCVHVYTVEGGLHAELNTPRKKNVACKRKQIKAAGMLIC
jgi:hypothetical protein